jgi:hypothetical protein
LFSYAFDSARGSVIYVIPSRRSSPDGADPKENERTKAE